MASAFSWQNSISLCPASFHSKAKFACYSRCFLTSYFCIPVPYNEKDIFFWHLYLLELAQIHVHWPMMLSNDFILCRLLFLLPSIFPSINLFQWVGSLHQVAKDWSFSFSFTSSNEYSGLISFRMDWLDLLTLQVTLKSLLQHHNSKASILLRSAFFMVQLSQPCMITGKIVTLTIQTFVGKVISWLFNMQIFIAFLPRTKHVMKNLVLLLFNVQTRLLTPLFSQRGYSQNVVRKLGYIAKAQVSL